MSAESSPLFRPQVLQAQQAQWLGSIHLARPMSFSVVAVVAVLLAIALLGFGLWGEVTRKVTVPGLLLPVGGLIQVSAPQGGVIESWLVREGEWVRAGQPLLRLRSERHTSLGEAGALARVALEQRRSSLEAEIRLVQQQGRQQQDALAERLRSLRAEERQAQAEAESAHQRVQLARQNLARYQELAASGFVSEVQAQQRQEELIDLQARESSARRNLQAMQRDQAALQAEAQASQASTLASMEQIERSLASLGQEGAELAARQGGIVMAPQAGRVSAMTQAAGQTVQAGQTLLSLVPTVGLGGVVRRSAGALDSAASALALAAASAAPAPATTVATIAAVASSSAASSADLAGDDDAPTLMEAVLFAPSRTAGFVQPGQSVLLRYAAYPYQKFGMASGTIASISGSPLSPQDLPAGQAQALLTAAQSNEPLRRITVRLERQHVQAYGQTLPLESGQTVEADVLQEHRKVWEWIFEPLLAARQQAGRFLNASPNNASPGG